MSALSVFCDAAAFAQRCGNTDRRVASGNRFSRKTGLSGAMQITEDARGGDPLARQWESSAERRRATRRPQRLPLALSIFNRPGAQEAWLIDCSREGVGVETYQPLLLGTSIQLRVVASVSIDEAVEGEKAAFPELRTTALGEVKWCAPLSPYGSPGYRVGIRYYSHY
jgi:hypothetical protein